jgi:hypothetical protein
LRFSRIAPADEGRYVCTASNIYGNTTKVAEVIVNTNGKFELLMSILAEIIEINFHVKSSFT